MTDELKQQIEDCFRRTKMQQEGDTELFDTELTIELLAKLIAKECTKARIDEIEELLTDHHHSYNMLITKMLNRKSILEEK